MADKAKPNALDELLKAAEDFEQRHGYTMPKTLESIDGCHVDAYTFNQETISVLAGCDKNDRGDNHANPIVVRLLNVGSQGQGEARFVSCDGETYFEMTTCGGWEHRETIRAFEFILDVLKNGKPTKDYRND